MDTVAIMPNEPIAEIRSAVSELVTAKRANDSVFINLPLFFPSGAAATVKIEPVSVGYRVSDNGFAYRELESIGAERSFGRTSSAIAEQDKIERNRRVVYVDVPADELSRAISDVGIASWRIVDKIFSDWVEEDQSDLESLLTDKLVSLFGDPNVRVAEKIRGTSSSEWALSAVVHTGRKVAAFQAVSNHPTSIFRTNSAFHDIAATNKPPALIAVVRDLKALGPRLSILSQAGRVIQEDQPDDIFRRAAA
jgi:hypothetical protein